MKELSIEEKAAVVAVIDEFMYGANLEADIASTGECFDEKVADAKYQLCKCIKGKIDTLEVKEVDLEKECYKYFEENDLCVHDDYIKFARHFFELGLKAQKGE